VYLQINSFLEDEDKYGACASDAGCCKLLQLLYLTLEWTNMYTSLVSFLHEWCSNTDTTVYNV